MVGAYSPDGVNIYGFLLSKGNFSTINFLGSDSNAGDCFGFGGTAGYSIGINDEGSIVGSYCGADGIFVHGFLLSHGIYSSIDVPGAAFTYPTGINSRGDIVGGWTADASTYHGFLLTK